MTKGKQWIRLNRDLELLDTPGILWPKFESEEVGKRLAMIGSMNDEILQMTELAQELLACLLDCYREPLLSRYQIAETGEALTPVQALTCICENRKCYKKGQEPDYEKAAALLVDDFRSGRIGRITLEMCGENREEEQK